MAGLAAGFSPRSFVVGPLGLHKGSGGWELRWAAPAPGIGGYVAAELRRPQWVRVRWFVHVAGGPLASLALWIAAWRLQASLQGPHPPEDLRLQAALDAVAFWGATGFACNLVPIRMGAWLSDGALLSALLLQQQGGQSGLFTRMSRCVEARLRAREWDVTVEEAVALARSGTQGLPLLYALCRVLDGGTREQLDRALPPDFELSRHQPPQERAELGLMVTVCDALARGEAARARARLSILRQEWRWPEPYAQYDLLAEAAVLDAEGDRSGAQRVLTQWLVFAATSPDPKYTLIGLHWVVETLQARTALARSA